ncbi:DNA internalization-related competence protein ComEC/Rec2 [candidate division KSB1 bacterium]|nr:DNA internalization-related competence protein ComEC/Rec2 [candidate division KSB1 bacterium]
MSVKRKPAVKALCPFVIGIFAAHEYLLSPFFLFAILLSLAVLCSLFFRNKIFSLFAFFFLFFAGYLRFCFLYENTPNSIIYFADLTVPVGIEGVISGPVENRGDDRLFTLDVDSVWVLTQPYPAIGTVRVTFSFKQDGLCYGDRIVAKGRLSLPPGERNPGEFNYKNYLASRNIQALFYVRSTSDYLLLDRRNGGCLLKRIVFSVRRWIVYVIESTLDGQEQALLKGLLVASKGDIDTELEDSFSNVGVIHVLAVSGLHVGFILLGLSGLMRVFSVPEPFRSILVIVGLFFYAELTGMQPPVLRASIMAALLQLGNLVQRPVDFYNSLAAAAFIILVLSPLFLFQAGFQLSFVAVLSIVFLYQQFVKMLQKKMRHWQEKGKYFYTYTTSLFLVSFAAQIGTLPLTMYYFGKIPLISLIANLIVVPLVGLIVAIGFISVAGAAVFWPIGTAYGSLNWLLLKILIGLVKSFTKIPFAFFTCSRPSLSFFVYYFLFFTLFVMRQDIRWFKRILFAILIFSVMNIWYLAIIKPVGVKLTFFDVGQGDSALFEFPGGHTMLVDAGESTGSINYGERVVAAYLQRNGYKKIDVLVVTHPHSDHEGGVPYLLEHYLVDLFIDCGMSFDSNLHTQIDSLCKVKNINVRQVARGDTLTRFWPAVVRFYSPIENFIHSTGRSGSEVNNASIVTAVSYGSISFLLAGDAELEAENAMERYEDLLRAMVFKVGHHGSSTASSLSFIRKVCPKYAIISVAKFNRFGLPSEKIIQRYNELGCKVIRTDQNGAVVFFTDGKELRRLR